QWRERDTPGNFSEWLSHGWRLAKMSVSWRENSGYDRGASTSGAGSWRWLNQDKKRRGPARTHRLTARKSIA
ncbi:MAG: hypothetical protein WA715_11225, partial [Candidatus Acidiferrum sp.]